jgi:hypothetical protein
MGVHAHEVGWATVNTTTSRAGGANHLAISTRDINSQNAYLLA